MKFEDYEPYNCTLYSHQREIICHIVKHRRCFIFSDIGVGKTMAALGAADFLMIHGKIKRVLIISPISVIMATWSSHIIKHFPTRTFSILHCPNKVKRVEAINRDAQFYIINTDGIKTMYDHIIKKKFNMVIIDESTTYSYHTSARTKCAWSICKQIPSVVCMTGNPIPSDTIQSYSQAKLVNFDRPKYFTKYRDQLKIKLDMYTYLDRDNAVEIAYSALQPSIVHKTEDCLDLPPITYQNIDIPMTVVQSKHYMSMEKDYITWLETGEAVTASSAAVKAMKLMQISSGILIGKDGEPTSIDHEPRLKELDIIVGQVDKLIVFANFTKSIRALEEAYPKAKVINGQTSANDRYKYISEFQDGDLSMLICQPKAISHGVTLHSAATIVWWSPTLSNEAFLQCNGRIRRSGQVRPQLIIMFRSSKVDKKIYSALKNKTSTSQELLSLGRSK